MPPRRQATRRASVRQQVSLEDAIKQLILDNGLQPGDPLPTEVELVEELNASRNSIREALKGLEALDIVEIRHGYGTRVGNLSLDPLTDRLTFQIGMRDPLHGIRELLDVREMCEVGAIRRVITLISDSEIEGLGRIVQRMEARARRGRWDGEDDRLFHKVLHRSLDNSLFTQLLETFWTVYQRVSPQLGNPPEPVTVTAWHRAIVKTVSARDADRSEQAMRAHFEGIRSQLQAGLDETGRR